MKYNEELLGESKDKSDYVYVKGQFSRKNSIMQKNLNKNFTLFSYNVSSSIIFPLDRDCICIEKCTINVDFLFQSTSPGIIS